MVMVKRVLFDYLETWLGTNDRKPLIIRGARQVGKTWLVRHFAKMAGKHLVEVNFEKQPESANFFTSNDPEKILLSLGASIDEKIIPEDCLLFLDEIQVVPEILAKLRWFAEDMPQLPVIAAGSLLDFVLAEHSFSMPVGRVSYAHLEPLSFEEFLLASKKPILRDYMASYHLSADMPLALHKQLMNLFKEYMLVGGMPAVVKSWIEERSLQRVSQIQHDLLAAYRDDYSKYKGRIAIERLDEVMAAVPKMLGGKFVYSQVNVGVQAGTIKQALNLLGKARIATRVSGCSANGVPLAAETREKFFKMILLDVGLCSASLELNLTQFDQANEVITINNGGLAEQVVGQLLRTINPPYIEPSLYYWVRAEKKSNAEIDYVIQHGNQVVPIEVKAGATGALKSLHLFMELKGLALAVRINSDIPSQTEVKVKNGLGENVQYRLISIPFYMVGQIHRLIASANNIDINEHVLPR